MKTRILFLISSLLIGCSAMTQEVVKFDDQNAANTVAAATQIMKHMRMNSAALREGLQDFQSQLPIGFWQTLDKLDAFATKYSVRRAVMTEADAGTIVVLAGKLVSPIIQQAVEQYAPKLWGQILKYLPALAAAAG